MLASKTLVACGNDTSRDWISVGKPFYFREKLIYPGASYLELFGSYPKWGDKFEIYDNNFVGLDSIE